MTDLPPEIWVADLIRALTRLECRGTRTEKAVMGFLGLDAEPHPRRASPPPPDPPPPPRAGPPIPINPPQFPFPSEPADRSTAGVESEPSTWTRLSRREPPPDVPPWLLADQPPAPGPTEPRGPVAPAAPAVPSLFPSRATRVIISTALAVVSMEGDIDIDSVVRAVAQGDAIQEIPRTPVRTNRRGVQVLLDTAPAMYPFFPDLAALPGQLERVIGPRVHALRFAGCPAADTGAGPGMRPWQPYRPPVAGTPVLVVTDLGSGYPWAPAPAAQADWEKFATMVSRAGCRAIALVPGREARVDPRLATLLPILSWDHASTVRDAARAAQWRT